MKSIELNIEEIERVLEENKDNREKFSEVLYMINLLVMFFNDFYRLTNKKEEVTENVNKILKLICKYKNVIERQRLTYVLDFETLTFSYDVIKDYLFTFKKHFMNTIMKLNEAEFADFIEKVYTQMMTESVNQDLNFYFVKFVSAVILAAKLQVNNIYLTKIFEKLRTVMIQEHNVNSKESFLYVFIDFLKLSLNELESYTEDVELADFIKILENITDFSLLNLLVIAAHIRRKFRREKVLKLEKKVVFRELLSESLKSVLTYEFPYYDIFHEHHIKEMFHKVKINDKKVLLKSINCPVNILIEALNYKNKDINKIVIKHPSLPTVVKLKYKMEHV